MKKLAVAIMLGLGVMVSGCGNQEQHLNVPTQQTQQVNDGISLTKAIDLAKKGEFKSQKVKFDGFVSDKIYGDESEIIVTHMLRIGDTAKAVHIHVTDPTVIKNVAKLQEKNQRTLVSGYGTMTVTEITSNDWNIDVYGCEVNE